MSTDDDIVESLANELGQVKKPAPKPRREPAISKERAIEITKNVKSRGAPATNPPQELDSSIYPWQMQPWETPDAYNAFQVYLSLGPERTTTATGKAIGIAQLVNPPNDRKIRINGKHKAADFENSETRPFAIANWCAKNSWVRRAAAWDSHLAELRFRAYEDEVEAMARRQAANFVRLQEIARKGLDELDKNGVFPTKWSDITNMLDTGAKAERSAMGIREAPLPENPSNFDFSNLTSAELEQFIQLHSKLSQHQLPDNVIVDGNAPS
jgi:hypothetical protein